jgi:sugar lactone lactonase YvrE
MRLWFRNVARAARLSTVHGLFLGTAVLTALLSSSTDAGAVGTRTFVLDTLDKLSGGDLKGTAVSSDGAVRAGFTFGNAPIPEAAASFSAVALADGTALIGTSPHGKVYKLAGDAVSVFADTGALAVTSMVQAKNGTVFAATMPDGKIFRISQGKADVFATLPDTSHVWALALDRAGTGLFAATGPEGKVFRVEPTGASSVYYRSTEGHLVSLALMDNGDLLAGSSGKGNLYRITGPGRASVLATLPGEEVKAVAVSRGVIWAVGNEYGETPEPPKRSPAAGRVPAGPSSSARTKAGKGVLYRFDAQGRSERMMKHDDTHYLSLVLDEQGRPYVGTGANGRIYTVDDAHVVTLLADTDERQIGAMHIAGGKGFVATSDPPVAHRILGRGGPDAVWTSKVLDATLRARFGTLSWRSDGALELSTRSGNTSTPDATWTAWSNPLTAPGAIASTAGRFVQVRARWSRDPNAVLTEVTIPFVTDNVRPVVTEVNTAVKGGPTKEPATGAVPASGGEVGKHESVVKVTWKVDNPDSDPLRYRIAFKREGQTQWRDALKTDDVHTKTELDWDTAALPEGKYRVRIEASDEPANPPDQVQKHALESETVLIDNTPPRIDELQIAGRRLRAHVVDGTSAIARVEMAVDGKLEWRPLAPADGVFDTRDERVDSDVAVLVPPGSHIIVVRAFDVAGNSVTRDVETK